MDVVDLADVVETKEEVLRAAVLTQPVVYASTIVVVNADGSAETHTVSMTLVQRCDFLEGFDRFACGTFNEVERLWDVCSNSDAARAMLMRELNIKEVQVYKRSRRYRPIR